MKLLLYLVFLIVFSLVQSKKPVDEQYCEGKKKNSFIFDLWFFLVCIKTISKFADELTDDEKSSVENIENSFKKYCSKVKIDSKEHRLVKQKFYFDFNINKFNFSVIILEHYKHQLLMLLMI